MKYVRIILIVIFLPIVSYSQSAISWSQTYGGSLGDLVSDGIKTTDGNYLIVGYTASGDGDFTSLRGAKDLAVVKVDTNGNKLWSKCFGGTYDDFGWSVVEGPNNKYYLAGITLSNEVDVTGNHGLKDAWGLCIDQNGNLIWSKCYGGSARDEFYDVVYANGKLLFVGNTKSSDGDVNMNYSSNMPDLWLVETDTNGVLIREKTFGGTGPEQGRSIVLINDTNPVILGYSESNDFDLDTNIGGYDAWVFRLNASWGITWKKSLGGSQNETMWHAVLNPITSRIALYGYTASSNGDVNNNHSPGTKDLWLVECSYSGTILFKSCFGSLGHDNGRRITSTQDGGYVLSAYPGAYDNDVYGFPDANGGIWLLKLDAQKNVQWSRCYRTGQYGERGRLVFALSGDRYLLAGEDNFMKPSGQEFSDWVLIEFDQSVGIENQPNNHIPPLKIFPNPAKDQVHVSLLQSDLNTRVIIMVFDQLGKAVMNIQINDPSQIETIDTSKLSPGSYIISVRSENRVRSTKLLIY